MSTELKKKYGLLTAICLVVGTVIGSGVFFKAQDVLKMTGGNMITGILAWAITGLVMLACILAFAIISTKHEKVNGVVDHLLSRHDFYTGVGFRTLFRCIYEKRQSEFRILQCGQCRWC